MKRRPTHRVFPGRIHRPPKGMCRWCGLLIHTEAGQIDRSKVFCGPICQTHHNLRADPQKMRQHVFLRDSGVCADCGFLHDHVQGAWEMDHIQPLMMAFGDPAFWDPDNVQILCVHPCHKKKSADDLKKYARKYRKKVREIIDHFDENGG